MRRYWISLLVATAWLLSTGGAAQAVVLKNLGVGKVGVAPLPGTTLPGANVDTSAATCSDPALATQSLAFTPGSHPLCWRGGSTIHSNETFGLTWDADRRYWSGTRGFVEQFLADVAKGSGSLSSPYAVTTQYTDGSGRAQNASKYGGGCIDYGGGTNAGTTCQFGSSVQTGPGNSYPASGCAPTGTSYQYSTTPANNVCLTDAQIQPEVQSIVQNMNMSGRTQPGHTPVVVVLLPAQVESCLDAAGTVCSANSSAAARFCSYHGQTQVGSDTVDYVVQPWSVYTGCDEIDFPPLPTNPTPAQISADAGQRLVSPLSAGHIASIVNPGLDGWAAADGSEIDDNDFCAPHSIKADTVPVGPASYALQREYNNAAAIETDPNTYFGCAPDVIFGPRFVLPSAVDQGDIVLFDGSSTASTLLVPNASYQWDFGDGQSASGPSVTHAYDKGGTFAVKLTVTDRGNNTTSLTQSIVVLGPDGNPVPPTTTPTTGGGQPGGGSGQPGSNPGGGGASGLQARLLLIPQGLQAVLRHGVALRLTSNQNATGFATITISRAQAKRAGIKAGNRRFVVIGRGTLARIQSGSVRLRLGLPHNITAKLARLRHVTLTIRIVLMASGGGRVALDAAGQY